MKRITIPEETYWKLLEIAVKSKRNTWRETINRLRNLVVVRSRPIQ